jgi:hypothetical protein
MLAKTTAEANKTITSPSQVRLMKKRMNTPPMNSPLANHSQTTHFHPVKIKSTYSETPLETV